MQERTDEEVMVSYQSGETHAMDELLKRYKNPVYHFAYRLCLDAHDAEDIAQEVFLRIHQYKDTYTPCGKFSTWIFGIAHHLCVSRFRKNKWLCFWPRKNDDPDETVEFESNDPSPKETAQGNELSALVQKSIQGLPFLQKEALILREYHDLDYQEISRILKKSIGTVKTLIHRARMQLKANLLPLIEEGAGGSHV